MAVLAVLVAMLVVVLAVLAVLTSSLSATIHHPQRGGGADGTAIIYMFWGLGPLGCWG